MSLSDADKFPVTESYAKTIFQIHLPWNIYHPLPLNDADIHSEFERFIQTHGCPDPVKISYYRAKKRYEERHYRKDPIASQGGNDNDHISEEDQELLQLIGKHQGKSKQNYRFPVGENYDWSKTHVEVSSFFEIYEYLVNFEISVIHSLFLQVSSGFWKV